MKLDLHLSWNETPNRSGLSNFSPAGEEQLRRDEQVNIHVAAAGSSEGGGCSEGNVGTLIKDKKVGIFPRREMKV